MTQSDDGLDTFMNAPAEDASAEKPRKKKAKAAQPEPVPDAPDGKGPSQIPEDRMIEDRLYNVLRQRNIRNNTPTEVCFRMTGSQRK